jgi:hypothetical protein
LVTNIRFFDSDAAAAWSDLSAARAVSLLPVDEVDGDYRAADLADLRRAYGDHSPYVFVHVTAADRPRDEIVVWADHLNRESALVLALSSAPVADTLVQIALHLPVESVFFVWEPRRLSLVKHYLLRSIGRRSAVPLDVLWLLRGRSRLAPSVLIRTGNRLTKRGSSGAVLRPGSPAAGPRV